MHNDTAYGLLGEDRVRVRKIVEGRRVREESTLKVIPFVSAKATARHGLKPDGEPRPYKGYKGDSNYCIEIVRNDKGKWEGEVISTYEAYHLVRKGGLQRLRHPMLSLRGKPLVMRLMIDDLVLLGVDEHKRVLRVSYMATAGTIALAECHEANVDKRTRNKELSYTFKTAGSLQKAECRHVSVSPIGELRDPGFPG